MIAEGDTKKGRLKVTEHALFLLVNLFTSVMVGLIWVGL